MLQDVGAAGAARGIDRARRASFARLTVALAMTSAVLGGSAVLASDCTQTSTGKIPISDLGAGVYLGRFQGGLYPGGFNVPPPAHAASGLLHAAAIKPRAPSGALDPDGHYVLLSIGMSNTTQEFCSANDATCAPWSFMAKAADHPQVDTLRLRIANGAKGGQTAMTWDSPTDGNYDRVRDTVLAPQGLSEAQVAAVWVKVADAGPTKSLPAADADAYALVAYMGNIARAVRTRYPNVQEAFLSSRIYAGYASTTLNPEPYAYESAFAVKWLIQAQIVQMATGVIDPLAGDLDYGTVAPWLGWGPYLWADGTTPRSDGLVWNCADFENDGTHPSTSGESKVADLLLNHFLTSPFAHDWFTGPHYENSPDFNGDGAVNGADLAVLLGHWGACPGECAADINGDGVVNGLDLSLLLGVWGAFDG